MAHETRNRGLLVTFEGVGDEAGLFRWCWPEPPDYASSDLNYTRGLIEPPEGGEQTWDPVNAVLTISPLTMVVAMHHANLPAAVRPASLGWPWMRVSPQPITEFSADADDTTTTIFIRTLTQDVPTLQVGSILYAGTEAMEVTAAPPGTAVTVQRGALGTEAEAHSEGQDIFDHWPTMVGKRVQAYSFEMVGGSSGGEALVYSGYVSSEPAADVYFTRLEAQGRWRFVDALVGPFREAYLEPFSQTDSDVVAALALTPGFGELDDVEPITPSFDAAGSYWYATKERTVYEARYQFPTSPRWDVNPQPVAGEGFDARDTRVSPDEADAYRAYEVILSDVDRAYSPFGYFTETEVWVPSDHPLVIFANMLVSRPGVNRTVGRRDYNVPELYPRASLGVDISLLDQDSLEREMARLWGARAARLWLGAGSLTFDAAWASLLAPFFLTAGVDRTGRWRVIGLRDIYPLDSVDTLGDAVVHSPEEIGQPTAARALDQIELWVDPTPEGEGVTPVTITEPSGRKWYRRQVGSTVSVDPAPYYAGHLRTDDPTWAATGRALRRYALPLLTVFVSVAGEAFSKYTPGDRVKVQNRAIIDPRTGHYLGPSGTLGGFVTEVVPNWDAETAEVGVALPASSDVKLSHVVPCATVESWNPGTTAAIVAQHDYTPSWAPKDITHFSVGDACMVVNSRGVAYAHSSFGVPFTTSVVSIDEGTDTLTFAGDFAFGPESYTPVPGDIITFAHYTTQSAAQKASWASGCQGGEPAVVPQLSNGDTPYQFGD